MPSWVDHAVFWQVYPLRFVGAPAEADGSSPPSSRLRRLEPWLDYLIALGANGLLLGPIFASETHGYDTVDHFRIDPRLGTEADLDALVDSAHSRGIRVVLDGVFNHVARSFPDLDEFARRRDDGTFETFEGHEQLVALNHDAPCVADHVADVMHHWLSRGVDGWRLDAAYAIAPRFWREVLARVRRHHPDAWFLAEMIHGDYAGYVTASTVDSVTQYELWKAVWSSLNDRNFFELAHALRRHNALLDTFVPQTFVGNHDVTRIATRLADPSTLPLALVALLTLPGIPSIYAGDEQAFTGVKEDRAGGDDAIRPEFPRTPSALPPGGADVHRLHQRLIGQRRQHPWLVGARTEVLEVSNTRLTYVSRGRRREESLTVTLSLDGSQTSWVLA